MRNLKPGLARPLRRPLPLGCDQRGVIGVLVAVLMGTGVLVGLGAMVIDTGQLYQQRAELQNGADAGALAVAKSCATGTCSSALAAQYANENASKLTGNSAAVGVVCGSVAPLTACGVSTGPLDCPVTAPSGEYAKATGYVNVHTSTKLSGGSTVLPPVFAKTLLGNGSYTGSTVLACSQAAWGGVSSPGIITAAFTISACEWWQATTNGTVYASATAPSPTLDRQIKLRSGAGTGCTNYAAPDDAVSKFGWMKEGNNGGCTSNSIPGPTYPVLTSAPTDCNPNLSNGWTNANNAFIAHTAENPIYIPVYTSVTGCCGSAVYNLLGIAAFVVTGYNVPATFGGTTSEPDWLKSTLSCSGSTYCINGYFVAKITPFTGSFGTANLGLSTITLSG